MPKLDKKTMLMLGGGVALIVLFLYMRSKSSSSGVTDTLGNTSQTPDNSGAADLATGMANQAAQEQGDISTLSGQMAANAAQEQADVSGLAGIIAGMQTAISNIPAGPPGARGPAGAAGKAVHVAAGQKKGNGKAQQHGKTGTRNSPPATPAHTNNHHPAGTAKHSVAQRSHAPHRAPTVGARMSGLHPAVAHPAHPNPARIVPQPPAHVQGNVYPGRGAVSGRGPSTLRKSTPPPPKKAPAQRKK